MELEPKSKILLDISKNIILDLKLFNKTSKVPKFIYILCLCLLCIKLLGVNIPWWVVVAPILIPISIFIFLILLIYILIMFND